ncbi:autotransporter domain-containing protein [Neorhizobium sp. NCHU2750]|uniref:autotransporter domain-containing protein n=1 Tax=Neorhizobium sp. NCHU2750 TaxID=1825976 RepID=UPI0013C45026
MGIVSLASTANASVGSDILGLSSDGSVMLNYSYDADTETGTYLLTTTSTGETQQITPPAGAMSVYPSALSADGKTVTGYYVTDAYQKVAFVWTAAGGFVDLGVLDEDTTGAFAQSVSGDGSAVAGYVSIDSYMAEGFYWSSSTGMVGIGTLGGRDSYANAISTDGSTVVGRADTADEVFHAFVWSVDTNTMQNIDTLYTSSSATLVSDDGTAVAGTGSTGTTSGVFRWTADTGMVDIGTLGGIYTSVAAMSGDGNVLVGQSTTVGESDYHAYRYVASTSTMTDLGTLGGTYSYASDLTADGSIVVGRASDSASAYHGFVWSEATGMQTVEDWLTAHGATLEGDMTTSADKISADGSVIVGSTTSGSTYIARVVTTGSDDSTGGDSGGGDSECNADVCDGGGESGIIDTAKYFPTVASANNMIVQSGVNSADTIMFGAQGAPMRNLLKTGQKSVWGTVDGGYDDSDHADGGLALGDFGFGYGIAEGVTARFSAGMTYTDQDLDAGGDVRQRGFYLSPEVSADLGRNVYMTVGGYWGRSSIDSRRGYASGAITDYSYGDTNAETWGAKIRFDWLNAATIADTAITPYAGLSYAHTRVDGFSETGGAFPVEFDGSSDHATIARLGSDFVRPLNDTVRLLAKAELDYQFENHAAATTGTLTGISDFDLEGQDLQQFWVRGGLGAEFDVGKGVASFMVNATTKGQDPTVWLRSNYTVKF